MGTLNKRCVIIGGGDCSVDILKNNILFPLIFQILQKMI